MRNLTPADFDAMGWHAPAGFVEGLCATQGAVYSKYGINTAERLAMMFAQFSHECGAGRELEESLNYSSAALLSQWPNHFTTEQAETYGRTASHGANQVAIGNLAYGGRMGNAVSSHVEIPGEGYNFRGRGLIQTTGRDGYVALAHKTRLDLFTHPELVNDPAHALLCGVAEFVSYPNMLALCDAGNVEQISREINGGTIGLDQRKAWTLRWLEHLGIS